MIRDVLSQGAPTALDARLRETDAHFEAIANTIEQMVWSTRPDGYHDWFNRRWYEYTGVPEGSTDGEAWSGMFHPDDRERTRETWNRSLTTGEPYHIEYRLRHRSGEYRWVIGRARCVRDAGGAITRWYGTCTDIHDLKEAEAARALIAGELSHRIKNIFAVVTSLVRLPARGRPEMREYAEAAAARIAALGAAHEYVRPHSPESAGPEAPQTVHGLLRLLTLAYQTASCPDGEAPPIAIEGDDPSIGARAATALALIVHELCTNAVKYGALCLPGGSVSVACRTTGATFTLTWRERDGPPIAGPPGRSGFGTTLSEGVLAGQLGASITRNWHADGLEVVFAMPRALLAE
jgi:PAS domain S-box-containing protein